ncbi:hypothetical protein Tco_1282884 [Tanacetum coccineum]
MGYGHTAKQLCKQQSVSQQLKARKGRLIVMCTEGDATAVCGGSCRVIEVPLVVDCFSLLSTSFHCSFHGHGLGRGTIIQIFYHRLNEPTQAILDDPNEAHQFLEDRVILKLDWSKENKTKPLCKTVSFAESEENSPLLEKMEALTKKIDSQFKEIRGYMNEMRDRCNKCGGPHPSSDFDDKPMGGPKEEESNYASEGYRGGYRANYYGRNSSNWRDRQSCHRDENRNSNPGEENPPIPRLPKKKPDESEFEKTMREFRDSTKGPA